jgi:hypothetical protein
VWLRKIQREAVTDLHVAVREIAAEMSARPDRGEVANYIPELARPRRRCWRCGHAVLDPEHLKNERELFAGRLNHPTGSSHFG